ncbi:MAG: TonB-dependent receptor [Opitutales bacterium]|nr:TonB-dependent receptor [Opitutales bacterium]
MLTKKTIRWSRWGLPAFLAVAVVTSGNLYAQEDEELEAFTVTGSRIPRLDLEGPNPVLRMTPESLEATGFNTVGEQLRTLPFNSGQALTPIDSGTSFTPGISTINLRGLGNNNVLVLVNGRRAAPFGASGFNGFQTLFDFNSIPASAIESVEILKDGASAIYGSDAVSGVVNINLRRDFEGMTVSAGIGNTFSTDSFEKSGFIITGARSARTSVVVTADWYERNALFARDMGWSSNADLRDVGGADRRSAAGFPGLVWVPDVGYRTFPEPTSNPTVEGAIPYGTELEGGRRAGFYNFLDDSDFHPEVRQYGFYTSLSHEITDNLRAYADVSFRRVETLNQSAPTPSFSFAEQGYFREPLSAAVLEERFGEGTEFDPRNREHYSSGVVDAAMVIPAYNPFNPWGVQLDGDLQDHYIRLVEVGNRINDIVSDTPRIVVGLDGNITPDWTFDVGALYTMNNYTNANQNNIQDRLMQDALDGVVFGAGTPEEELLYLNPFGPNDERILDYITITNPVTSRYETYSFDFSVGGTIFDLPAGPLGVAAGGEYREEDLSDFRTALNETGQIVGGSEGSSIFGSRNVKALYAELAVPVLPNLELQLAGRFEDYSDFGSTTKPKISGMFRPIPSVILRAAYSESFLAPNLPFLYSTQSTSFTASALADPRRPDDDLRQIRMLGGGNPDLQPETTETIYLGVAFSPEEGPMQGWYFGVDYFIFDSTNLIDRNDAQFLLDNELDEAGNPTEFTQFVVRGEPAPGESVGLINFVRTTWENISERKYKGFDFDVRYEFDTDAAGRFRLQASATYQEHLSFGGANQTGSRLLPKWRGNFNANWRYADWSASVFVNYIHSRSGTNQVNPAGAQLTNARYASQITVNPAVTYSGFLDTRITLGVRNVFDRDPPLDYGEATRYTGGVNLWEPAFWYLRVTRDF